MEAGARKLGYKEVHTGRPNGRHCMEIPKGEATGNLEVRPNSMAVRVEQSMATSPVLILNSWSSKRSDAPAQ